MSISYILSRRSSHFSHSLSFLLYPPPSHRQVLVSISAMILVPDPYFNEPGYESTMLTSVGKEEGRKYNEQVHTC